MVNIVSCYMSMLHKMMKLLGMHSIDVEINPETTIRFWVNTSNKKNNKEKKPPVILLHGFAGDGLLTWQFQILALRKKYTLYVPDLLFFGRSHSTNKTERSTKFQAECLVLGLKKLGVEEKCVVVGFSYGGFVGFQMAQHYPNLVGSLVVSGSVDALTESISSGCLERIGFASWTDFLMPDNAQGAKVLLDIGSYDLPWMPDFFYKHYCQIMFSNRKERVELLEALVVKDEDAHNHQFQQRIHLLCGSEDKVFNMEVVNSLKKKLGSKTELQVIKNAGHLVLLERPIAFNKCLVKILASLTS
ncbi:monoacylglycerol lipase ABHD6-like [Chenopodium quinoa]|nr:monoacylglycerol lipase ABHD6-like [Chenopodium quinoa]